MYEPKPNEVGAIWPKRDEKGESLVLTLELQKLIEHLLHGEIPEKVYINVYPVESQKPTAPRFKLMYYPKTKGYQQTAPEPRSAPRPDDIFEVDAPPPVDDDDILF